LSERIQSAQRRSLLAILVMFFLSLVAAVVLFYFLDSFARIQSTGIELGGAAAGFVAVFLLLRNTYYKLTSADITAADVSADEKIQELQEQIRVLIEGKLDNFTVPTGFKSVISPEFEFGFCYPQDWQFTPYPQNTQYGIAIDLNSPKSSGRGRNLLIAIADISKETAELDQLYEQQLRMSRLITPSFELVYKQSVLFLGLPALKIRNNAIGNDGFSFTNYQILVANKGRKYLYTICFTDAKGNFDASQAMFDSIASTFRIR
jgi:hypothetical protein